MTSACQVLMKSNQKIMSTFKIVSTKERKGVYYTAVPHSWECDGTLLWPEHIGHTKREMLRSNPKSMPDECWSAYQCILKCEGIPNFKTALDIEKKLTECIDTDAEEALFEKKTKGYRVDLTTNRNRLFESLSMAEVEESNSLPCTSAAYVYEELTPNTVEVINAGKISTNAEELIENELSNLRYDLSDFKNQIKNELFKINLNLDKIFSILSSQDKAPRMEETGSSSNLIQEINFPLCTCEDINMLEENIKNNKEFRTQLVRYLSKIGGCSGAEDGTKVAYKIVDYIFKSDVFLNYSWTGVSRTTSGEKKPFQLLDGILGFFFEVISLADSRHTHKKNSSIFKDGILKHAKKRSARKRIQKDATLPTSVPGEEQTGQDETGNTSMATLPTTLSRP